MEDHQKTRTQLINELTELRQHLYHLQAGQTQQRDQAGQISGWAEGMDYHYLFEQMNAIILIIDPETGEIVDANPAACEYYGYSHTDLLKTGFPAINTLPPGQTKIELARAIKREKNYSHDRHRLANGEIRDVEIYSNPIQTGGKQLLISVIHDETECKRAEETLRKFSRAVELNPASILITDVDGTIEYVNPRFTELAGYSTEEVLGKNSSILRTDYTSPEEYTNLWKTITSGETWKGKFCSRKKNGEIYWETASISPVKNNLGEVTHFVAIKEDISDRTIAEEALENERRLLRTVIDNIPDQIFAHDQDCRFILNNVSDARVMGVDDPATMLGKSDLDFYPPELAARFQQDDRHVMDTNQPLSIHGEPSKTTNGQQRWVSTIKVPFHDNQGQVIGLVGVARDITQRKLAEDELFHSRQMLQLVMDNIPLLTFWKDSQLTYLGCNQIFSREAGFATPAEVVGKTDYDLAWKEVADQYRRDDQRIMEMDAPYLGYEEVLIRLDGSRLWVRTNKVPLHDQEGKVIGILGTYEDITERKQVEQEIEKANEKLMSWVNDLERRNHEANILRQMSGLLQVSNDRNEYYLIIKEYVPRLFLGTSGALFILNNILSTVDAVATWGDDLRSERSFAPAECWAFRLGQIHKGNSSNPGLICRHVKESYPGNYLEVPITSSGETTGILFIENPEKDAALDNLQDLACTLADHLSLSLSNLKLRETLRSQSIRDPLTGLYNRRYMEESLGRELPRAIRKKTPVGIIMLDIDHFKVFNDTYGHKAGDSVLRELGILFQSHIRSEDIACRFGGEEFILILPESDQEMTVKRAEHIRELVKAMRVEYHQQSLGVITVSLGVAIFPEHSSTAEGILNKADEALYQAKRRGRDRVEVAQEI